MGDNIPIAKVDIGGRQCSISTPILTPVGGARPAHDYQCGSGEQSPNWNCLRVVKREVTVSSVAVVNMSDIVSPRWMLVKGVKRQRLDSPPTTNSSVDIYDLRPQRCVIRKQRPSVEGGGDAHIPEREWSGDIYIHEEERVGDVNILERERSGAVNIPEKKRVGDVNIHERERLGADSIQEKERVSEVNIHARGRVGVNISDKKRVGDVNIHERGRSGAITVPEKERVDNVNIQERARVSAVNIQEKKRVGDVNIHERGRAGAVNTPEKKPVDDVNIHVKEQVDAVNILEMERVSDVNIHERGRSGAVNTPEKRVATVNIHEGERGRVGADKTPRKERVSDVDIHERGRVGAVHIPEKKRVGDVNILERERSGAVNAHEKERDGDVHIYEETQTETPEDQTSVMRMWPLVTGSVIHGPQAEVQEQTGGLWEEENNSPPRDGAQTVRDQEEEAPLAEQHQDGQPVLRMWPPATGLVIHGPQVTELERTNGRWEEKYNSPPRDGTQTVRETEEWAYYEEPPAEQSRSSMVKTQRDSPQRNAKRTRSFVSRPPTAKKQRQSTAQLIADAFLAHQSGHTWSPMRSKPTPATPSPSIPPTRHPRAAKRKPTRITIASLPGVSWIPNYPGKRPEQEVGRGPSSHLGAGLGIIALTPLKYGTHGTRWQDNIFCQYVGRVLPLFRKRGLSFRLSARLATTRRSRRWPTRQQGEYRSPHQR